MCLRSLVMAPVSLVGPLVNSMSDESFSDNWYLWLSSRHPPRTLHGVVHAPAASSRCKEPCTVTVGLTTGFESFCKDQAECLTKPADGKSFLCLGDTQSVGFHRVLRGEQWGNWHGGEFLNEDDYSVFFCDDSDAHAFMVRLLLSFLCHASLTSRPLLSRMPRKAESLESLLSRMPRKAHSSFENSVTNASQDTHVPVDASQDTHVPVDLKRAIKTAGAFGSSTTLRVVRFNSGEQQPKSRIGVRKSVGSATASDHLIQESNV